jgi:anti-anti-sigma regulatory factor
MVRLSGEYDAGRSRDLAGRLAEVYGADVTLLDMRDVTGVDSPCSGPFLEILSEARSKSRPCMVGVRAHIRMLLDACGLGERFDHSGTLRDALEGL